MYIDLPILVIVVCSFFYVFKFVILHVCQKPNNLYYFFMFFSTFVNIYFVVFGQLLATTTSLTLFIIELILV